MAERSEDRDHEFDRIVRRVYEDLEKGVAPDRAALLADDPVGSNDWNEHFGQ